MRKLTFFSLYFSEGAPIGFIWWAMPAILVDYNFSVTEIASITAIASLPWSLKFILAPLIDLISMNFLKLKKQLLFYQIFMGISIYFLPEAILNKNTPYLISIIVIHGLFAALQDICIDAIAIKSIPENELGKINGIMQTGMLVARSIFGGAGVYLAHKFGLNILIYFLISSIWISLILLQKTQFNEQTIKHKTIKAYLYDFLELLNARKFWILIGITYFAGFAYNGISTVAGSLLAKLGASPLLHGLTYSVYIPIFMASGALLGGFLSDKKNSIKVLQLSLISSIITSIFVGFNLDNFTSFPLLISSYVIFYFCIGAATSTLYGFLMQNTSKEFAALEYSIFMGIVNLCDSSSSYLTGQVILKYNYTNTSIIIAILCSFSFLFIKFYQIKIKTKL